MYLVFTHMPGAFSALRLTSGGVLYLVFTCMLGESYCMRLRS